MPSAIPQRGVRLDDELYAKLQYIAKLDSRSFNQKVGLILAAYVRDFEAEHGIIDVSEDEEV